MRFENKIVFLLILFYCFHINCNGQTITFNMLKKMIASRSYKDSIVNSYKFFKGPHLPAAVSGTAYESYRSRDSSKTFELVYKDSAVSCVLWTKDLNFLQSIIAAGRIDGFAKTTLAKASPKITAYVKGKYLLEFTDLPQDKRGSNVILTKNYQVFNVQLRSN